MRVKDEAEEGREGPRGALNATFRDRNVALCVMKSPPSSLLKVDLRLWCGKGGELVSNGQGDPASRLGRTTHTHTHTHTHGC